MARYYAKLDISGDFEASFPLPLFTGDSGSSICLEFYQNGKPYDMSGAVIYARRSDGTVMATSGIATGNKAEFTLYNTMYAYPGELQVQVSVVDVYGNFLTSGVLYFTVLQGFAEQSVGEGSNDFCELTTLIQQVGKGIEQIDRARHAADQIETVLQDTPIFRYKGSVKTYYQLPTEKEVGDVYSVEHVSNSVHYQKISTEYAIPVRYDSVEKTEMYGGYRYEFVVTDLETEYDIAWNDLGIGLLLYSPYESFYKQISVFPSFFGFLEGNVVSFVVDSLIENPEEITHLQMAGCETDSAAGEELKVITEYPLARGTNTKVFWNGSCWDTFTGDIFDYATGQQLEEILTNYATKDFVEEQRDFVLQDVGELSRNLLNYVSRPELYATLDDYATKDEIGDVQTALSNIEALQNSYIGGDGV